MATCVINLSSSVSGMAGPSVPEVMGTANATNEDISIGNTMYISKYKTAAPSAGSVSGSSTKVVLGPLPPSYAQWQSMNHAINTTATERLGLNATEDSSLGHRVSGCSEKLILSLVVSCACLWAGL